MNTEASSMTSQGESDISLDLPRLADETSAQIERLYVLSTNQIERQLEEHKLTITQYMALSAIVAFDKDVPISTVAAAIRTPPSSMTSIATRLEQLGLIVRHRIASDRRAVMVRSTDDGKKMVEAFQEQQRDNLMGYLASMPPRLAHDLPIYLAAFANTLEKPQKPVPTPSQHST